MVSAFLKGLGQRSKSNEIPAIRRSIGRVNRDDWPWGVKLKLRKIVDSDADYVLALKANQGQLYEDVQLLFDGVTGDIRDIVDSRKPAIMGIETL